MTIRNIDINLLRDRDEKVKLNHTKRYNLLLTGDRTNFIKEFVALLRFIAAGEANVGHLRKDRQGIHRAMYMKENPVDDPVLRPPQQDLTEDEENRWRTLYATNYTS